MTELVPVFKDLQFYSSPDTQIPRYRHLVETFSKEFGEKPLFISRSPGRVNLIGDHIDYCYFSVLPMAIEYDVIEAINTTESSTPRISLVNTDSNFKPEVLDLPTDGSVIKVDASHNTWGNYYRCSLIVAHEFILEKYPELLGGRPLKSLNVVVDGTVPSGGGLSSSAAICVASTLGILRANGVKQISKQDLTRITVVSEHYVGVNTGGMDQCASVYGEKNKVLFIEFKPKLQATPFEIPPTKPALSFLITNTLVQANKKDSAPVNYNLRVVEVAVGAEILARINGLQLPQDSNLNTGTLRGFMDAYFTEKLNQPAWDGRNIESGISRLTELSLKVEEWFTDSEKVGFSTEEAAARLGVSVEDFTKRFLSLFPVRYSKLKVYQRTKHVFTESLRVLQVLKLLSDPKRNPDTFLSQFGDIMNSSQDSLRDLFNNSRVECDELNDVARANGSIGSRITGAGFGGSLVHLTTEDKLEGLISALTEKYYKKHFPHITEEELAEAVVVTKPATGSCIVEGPI
ncbi:DEKNAAC102228 [Brettanomyces naardenensis]|uniref:Galactokinase n=1 Tax=Brettanomyces naardenensis TaxID=13370 RepID=A0A448YKL7_BRENA|nr:DEKNAAC102228 [Brettanomyces naardenensis]